MNWISLTSKAQVDTLKEKSFQIPQVIFKHSTRCSISSMVLNRLERSGVPDNGDFYYLDLIAHRDISNQLAEDFRVHHESPQVLVIRNGVCTYNESHMAITMNDISEQVA
ncbi:bacillithiol system redox-active protein YtxJ [Filimonas effusa]|uniref:Bacillithiol system redox-active protein YtxJ n=1 Tax=Filimonas effusa TaxID=2508721 RepID=A0A4V1MAV6_9BACT|nr:bacillithiol system redox-active protein YtxJ [Filimonas effusa]RXK87206.1 bacillithiol system redox-active protein YtxJ [Filimonas effusa]